MDKKFIITTIGFLVLFAVPGIVLGFNIKASDGIIMYVPIFMILVGVTCIIPMFRDKQQNSFGVEQ